MCSIKFCAVECPANSNEWQHTMQIKPRGINESLTVDLSIICDCPCDKPGHSVRRIIEREFVLNTLTNIHTFISIYGYVRDSEDCRGNGTLVCGVCSCREGFYGKQCECEGNGVAAESAAAVAECKPNNETTEICSGHGACKCGVCDCVRRPNPQEIFYGKYCECDNFSCKRSGGLWLLEESEFVRKGITRNSFMERRRKHVIKPCSRKMLDYCVLSAVYKCLLASHKVTSKTFIRSEDAWVIFPLRKPARCPQERLWINYTSSPVCGGRGKCECGVCNCFPEWGGETCDCQQTNSTCMPRNADEICSGRGDCICGSCHCYEMDNIRYSGQYCEECPICPDQRCEELKDCVECMAHNSGPLANNGKCDRCPHQLDIVDEIKEEEDDEGARICRTPGDAGCTFTFKYKHHRDGSGGDIKIFEIVAQKEKICPTPINVVGVAIGLIISTVIIGFLILLVWKILTMLHDKREYAKFERERAMAKWDRGDNPLYKKATSTFENPTFNETQEFH
ncbi:integrin beta-PS-like [Calliopsis andreniformis]|uniref:integrin beta-PS-like n=1 Tax=Calliopsis andreniformis TaxID=337506 RepID=UPI003FCE494B